MAQATKSPQSVSASPELAHGLMNLFRIVRYSTVLAAHDPVDLSTLRTLSTLAEVGPCRSSAVAASQHLDLSTISRQVATLERNGLISRSPDPDDGRASLIEITEEARALLIEVLDRRTRAIAPALDGWSIQDRTQLFELLARLADDLEPHVTAKRGTNK